MSSNNSTNTEIKQELTPEQLEKKLRREENAKAAKAAKQLKFDQKKAAQAQQAQKKKEKDEVAKKDEEEVVKKDNSQKDKEKEDDKKPFVDTTIPGQKKVLGPIHLTYQPKRVECSWYQWWRASGFFKPEYTRKTNPNAKKFTMVIPPPNVTGTLHLGHALTNSVEDTIARWYRMNGYETLWLPATDHAGIATQVVVEKKIAREQGLTRHDLGREKFVEQVWKWKEEYGNTIKHQLERLGSSLDWDRECFTMDERLSKAVTESFCRLYEKGLIYRENKLVNWCCALKTGISDIEVDYRDFDGPTKIRVPNHGDKEYVVGELTSFAYLVCDSKEEVVIATTRLETMLGDTAIAIHPDDTRYLHLHGKFVQHPFCDRKIPIICDRELVDMTFGTGCVKVTPAHDPNDYLCGLRHKLEFITILNEDGTICDGFGEFSKMKRFDCRERILALMKENGTYRGTSPNPMRIGFCSRSKDVIEPRLMPQWYVSCKGMADQAMEKAKSNELVFLPDTHRETWYRWLGGIRDWCVSRQLWWGHQIPAYLVTITDKDGNINKLDALDNNSWVVARDETIALKIACERFSLPVECITLTRDPDVLDTWFSSGVYPFSAFGWPDTDCADFKDFFPTTLLETGHDILFFWVARMVMMSLVLTEKLPFTSVYLHAMVRDAHGRKMSKSLGNVIDPIDVIQGISLQDLNKKLYGGNLAKEEIERAIAGQQADYPQGIDECGTDALRFALCAYTSQGRDINLDIYRVVGYRNFCNKVWNATRFGLQKLAGKFTPLKQDEVFKLSLAHVDLWILSKLAFAIKATQEGMEKYDFSSATSAVYQFWLYELCDVYLESIKPIFTEENENEKASEATRQTLCLCLDLGLRLLHPFMPFVTEELWQHLPKRGDEPPSIMVAAYPEIESTKLWMNPQLEDAMKMVDNAVRKIRGLNAPYVTAIKKSKKNPEVFIACNDASLYTLFETYIPTIELLSYTKGIKLVKETPVIPGSVITNLNETTTVVSDLKGIVDPKMEIEKLTKKLAKLVSDIKLTETKINDPLFETKTPANVQETLKAKLTSMKKEEESINAQIKMLSQ